MTVPDLIQCVDSSDGRDPLTLAVWPSLESVGHAANDPVQLRVEPVAILLDGCRATAQLIVTGIAADSSMRA